MIETVKQRMKFLSRHWQDAMNWRAIPFWCFVASETLYANRPWWYQLCILGAGVVVSWGWTQGLNPYIESRIGVMRRPHSPAQKVRWKQTLILLLPCLAIVWVVGSLLSAQHRQAPAGLLEKLLFAFLSGSMVTTGEQVSDKFNPLSRRIWYGVATLIYALTIPMLGYWPMSYAAGYTVFAMMQCALAIADLILLLRLAGPLDGTASAEVFHG